MRTLIDVEKPKTPKIMANTDKTVVNGQVDIGLGGVGRSKKHESADKQVAGEALYVDDRPALRGELHAAVGQSTIAHGNIVSMDLSAVKSAQGVVKVITVDDVPGHTDIGPVFPGDPVLALGKVEFVGQPIFAVAATSYELARKAVKLAKVEYETLESVLTVKDALAKKKLCSPALYNEAW
jgi:xanthine dehydrogenase large subunit